MDRISHVEESDLLSAYRMLSLECQTITWIVWSEIELSRCAAGSQRSHRDTDSAKPRDIQLHVRSTQSGSHVF